MKAATMQSEILRELEYMCDVAGLPVARYVKLGTGEASGHWRNRLARRADNSEVSGSIPECPT